MLYDVLDGLPINKSMKFVLYIIILNLFRPNQSATTGSHGDAASGQAQNVARSRNIDNKITNSNDCNNNMLQLHDLLTKEFKFFYIF